MIEKTKFKWKKLPKIDTRTFCQYSLAFAISREESKKVFWGNGHCALFENVHDEVFKYNKPVSKQRKLNVRIVKGKQVKPKTTHYVFNQPTVTFSNGVKINGIYLSYVKSRFPNAKYYSNKKKNYIDTILVYEGKNLLAIFGQIITEDSEIEVKKTKM